MRVSFSLLTVLPLVALVCFCGCDKQGGSGSNNDLPGIPTKPDGLGTVTVGDSAAYTTAATDPNGDSVRYIFDWGDGTADTSAWRGSGEQGGCVHVWHTGGTMSVRARAQDKQGGLSPDWSQTLGVDVRGLPGEFEPTGTPFVLNPDIGLVAVFGSPSLSYFGPFALSFLAISHTQQTELDTLPAGLTFRRRNTHTQHMLVLKSQTVNVAAAPDTSRSTLGTFCCNKLRICPDDSDTFDIGPITDNVGLQTIVSLLSGKDFSRGADMWMVQRAVYMVTDSTGLNQAYVDSILALPADTTD